MGANISTVMVVVALAAGLWWGFSRRRRQALLQLFSIAALALAVVTLVVEGPRWQLVPWQVLALSVAAAAGLRRWRPGRSRRWRRAVGRGVLVVGLALGGLVLLTALVPALPKPSGPHRVGSVIFRWTDNRRSETFTADPSDRRQVVAQAWYPTDATTGQTVPYFEAQGRLPSSISGLPSFLFASFGSVATHAIAAASVSAAQRTWPVLFLSPGLSIPREQYTALSADLASRGYVVVALSVPYESSVSVLVGGRVVGQTTHPDVMGPPPHRALERLIDIRAADSRFVLDQLSRLAQLEPGSSLAGHLDLQHVGIVGHSIGGATAVQVMARDPRFKVGVDLDGKLFGTEPKARLNRPFLWIQSGAAQTTEYQPALLQSVKLNAMADAVPLTRRGGWPVVLFSPGFGVERELYAGLVEDLSSHGYVVVAIDHPHDASIVEFPDGHVVVPSSQMDITAALSVRVADTRFVLTELARLGRAGFFAGRLDLGYVGMFGHSLGGAAAASTMLVDPRIDAGADLDGVLFGGARTRGLSRPFMLMSAEPGFAADPNRAGFWSRLRGPHYAVDIKDTRHFAFSDLVFFAPALIRANASTGERIRALVGNVDGPTTLTAEHAYLLAFFDRFLRGKQEPLLSRIPGPFTGVRLTVGR